MKNLDHEKHGKQLDVGKWLEEHTAKKRLVSKSLEKVLRLFRKTKNQHSKAINKKMFFYKLDKFLEILNKKN